MWLAVLITINLIIMPRLYECYISNFNMLRPVKTQQWSLGVDLNHRLLAYEASVLPLNYPAMALGVGLEPNITGLKGLRTNHYSTRAYCGSAYFAFLYTAFH